MTHYYREIEKRGKKGPFLGYPPVSAFFSVFSLFYEKMIITLLFYKNNKLVITPREHILKEIFLEDSKKPKREVYQKHGLPKFGGGKLPNKLL